MKRTPVSSSNLASVGYDSASRTLEIEFNNGYVYRYNDVSESVHRDLMSASSHGRYFNANIKGAYPYYKAR